MKIRNAEIDEFDKIIEIFKNARNFMVSFGNNVQWHGMS